MNSAVCNRRIARAHARRGFTLVEIAIGATILFVLAAALVQSLSSVKSLAIQGDIESRLQREGDEAMAKIRRQLHLSGFTTIGAKSYPHVFPEGVGGAGFGAHDHAPASSSSVECAPDNAPSSLGPNREIVLVEPVFMSVLQTADGTNYPTGTTGLGSAVVRTYDVPEIDVGGNATWGAPEISFVVVTGADGRNVLERRVDGADPRVVCRFVARATFETTADDPVQVPLDSVRVRLWLQDRDEKGGFHGRFFEALVGLRNG